MTDDTKDSLKAEANEFADMVAKLQEENYELRCTIADLSYTEGTFNARPKPEWLVAAEKDAAKAAPDTIQPGHVVRLKSGGPKMTVVGDSSNFSTNASDVNVVWHEHGVINKSFVRREALMRIYSPV